MGHDHGHGAGSNRTRLAIALGIVAAVLVAEVVGALLSGSLALLADAGHMSSDAIGLLVALVASVVAARPATDRHTFGFQRVEVLAALLNGVLLSVVAVTVAVEGDPAAARRPATRRCRRCRCSSSPGIGLLANVAAMLVLRGGDRRSLNMRGAYLEVFGDLLGSIAALGAAAVILLTGFVPADAIASLLIAAFIVPRAFLLLRDVVRVLTESAPRETNVEQIRAAPARDAGRRRRARRARLGDHVGAAGVHGARRVRRRGLRSAGRRARCSTARRLPEGALRRRALDVPAGARRPRRQRGARSSLGRAAEAAGRAVEDYLKVIYGHTEWQPDPISPSQLAARLGLAPSTVTEMVKKLVVAGHVEHAPYGAVRLTASGRGEALRMVRRHRLVETWLVQPVRLRLGRGARRGRGARAHAERPAARRDRRAARASASRSARRPDPVARRLGRDPGCGAAVVAGRAGSRGRVVRISDRDAAVLREIAAAGVGLDSELEAGALAAELAGAIWVVRLA